MKDFYTVEELANELAVTSRTIRNYLKTGQLTGTKVGGQWRFSQENILPLIGAHFSDPLLTFTTNRQIKKDENSALVIDHLYTSPESLQALTHKVFQEFNEVYAGDRRSFHYEKLNAELIRFTLIGPVKYLLNFGAWIENQF